MLDMKILAQYIHMRSEELKLTCKYLMPELFLSEKFLNEHDNLF